MHKDRHKPSFTNEGIKSGILLSGTLAAVTVVTGAILMSTTVNADDPSVVDEVNITVPISCSLSGTGMDTHNDNVNNGQYKADIGTTTLTAFCNDNNGFAIYANGYTNNEDGSNVLSNTTLGTTHDIASGIAESGDTSNWAMKLTKKTDSGDTTGTNAFTIDSAPNTESGTPASFETYHTVPTTFTKVAHKDSSTDMDTTNGGVKLETTYAAYINKTQAAGTYSGKVKYVLVHPSDAPAPTAEPACDPGKVCYNANANDTTGSMGQQSLVAKDWSSCAHTDHETYCYDSDDNEVDINTLPDLPGQYVENVMLQASNFKRSGYGFAGWNDKADMTGTNYGPNQSIPVSEDMKTKGLNLYAYWVESSGNLQGWTGCSALTTNQVIGLTDTRDGNVYAVAKLADNNCWMIENLRLADTDSTSTTITLNSTNTNNPASGFTALAATSNDWCTDNNNESCINQNKLNTTNTISFTSNTTSTQSSDIYSYGNYYNWYSATAGNGTYSQASGNAAGDICPSGWALPTGNTGGQFEALNTAINSGATNTDIGLRAYPANFIHSGNWYGSSAYARGSGGNYWSRTAIYTYNAYGLGFGSADVGPGTYSFDKYDGLSARCIAQ